MLGGTGFFGKSFLDAFARGLLAPWGIARVIAAARRPDVLRERHPELLVPGVELLALDAGDRDARLPASDYLVHAANTTDAARYRADPLAERSAIVGAAEAFVHRAARDCPGARVIYASSGAVYGAQGPDAAGLEEEAPLADAATLTPYKRDYAEAKRLSEDAVARLGHEYEMAVSVARCFAFVGPYLPRDQHFAVGNFLADGMAGRAIRVTARSPVVRSYMHADDLVHWLMTISHAATPDCPVYNVGSDHGVDVAEVAVRVGAIFGVPVELAPDREAAPVDRYVPSVARARTALGLELEHDLDGALRATAARLAPGHPELVATGGSATAAIQRKC